MYKIEKDTCVGCRACEPVCPVDAIHAVGPKDEIDSKCIDCGTCVPVCPVNAIHS